MRRATRAWPPRPLLEWVGVPRSHNARACAQPATICTLHRIAHTVHVARHVTVSGTRPLVKLWHPGRRGAAPPTPAGGRRVAAHPAACCCRASTEPAQPRVAAPGVAGGSLAGRSSHGSGCRSLLPAAGQLALQPAGGRRQEEWESASSNVSLANRTSGPMRTTGWQRHRTCPAAPAGAGCCCPAAPAGAWPPRRRGICPAAGPQSAPCQSVG